jgi:hypothetical protein
MATSTRTALLAAAEAMLVEQGVNALSVRRVGEAAGLNPTLARDRAGLPSRQGIWAPASAGATVKLLR